MYLYFNGTIMKEDNCFPLFVESKITFIYKVFAIAVILNEKLKER